MNVEHFAFYMPRTETALQQTQIRDDHYFLSRRGKGLRNFHKHSFTAKTAGKIVQRKPWGKNRASAFYYPAPVSYFKRYSCMHKLSPTKEKNSQHKRDNNISHTRKLSNIPLPLPLPPKKIMVCVNRGCIASHTYRNFIWIWNQCL